ncbi:MAG: hypothetical protein IIT56_05010 [Bacteroidales bacterium]|nr:hypothetical protein [Bacteroidales bacterium]
MEVECIRHKDIDYDGWQDCTDNSVNACLYSRTWFLDSISKDWQGLVLGDYEAVMPLFVSQGKVYLPEFMDFTGVYCGRLPVKETVPKFLKFISSNFKYADIRLDKFSGFQDKETSGQKMQYLYQFDTVNSLKDRLPDTSERVKRLMMKLSGDGFCFQKISDSVFLEAFMRVNSKRPFKQIDAVGRIVSGAVKNKSCVAFFLSDKNDNAAGMVTAFFDSNYIYVQQLDVVSTFEETAGQMIMLYHILTYFEGSPLVLVVDPHKLHVSESLLQGMGAKKFGYVNFRKDRFSFIKKLLKL